jgi:MFS family permease
MYLPPRRRIHGVFAMAVGAFGQNVITNVLGFIAMAWFAYTFLDLNTLMTTGVFVFSCTSIAFFLILYFNIKWAVWLLDRIPFLKKFHRFFEIMGRYRPTELRAIMYFCLGRFFIFSFQYYLVIHLLVPQIPMYEVFLMVFIVFFIQSALPSLDVLDIAVRTYAATTIFAYVTTQEMAIAAAFASIWLINLIFPAIIGSVFTLNIKFFDRNA